MECALSAPEMHVDPAHSFGAPNPFFRRNEIEALRAAVLTASCCSASCPFLPRPWASCVSYVAVFDATFCCWPSCPDPSCPGPSCHPSFYPAAPQCRSATKHWQGQVEWPYKPTRWSQRWPHVIFFSAFLVLLRCVTFARRSPRR